MNRNPLRCDIFCAVIDNFGDAAVCWRLARQLTTEYGWLVRLFIDQPAVLSRLIPQSEMAFVDIIEWCDDVLAHIDCRPDVVIETFSCNPPEPYIEALANSCRKIAWINVEYLSAEHWIEDFHLQPSRHPRLSLEKLFYFPGFTPRTGGVLRESDYEQRRTAFDPARFRQEFNLPATTEPEHSTLTISLFSYPTPHLTSLIDAWAASPIPIHVLQPGRTGDTYEVLKRGSLTLTAIPFLPQQRYDELLWLCDVNFVRGEDSFVRAQLAGKPLVWHIYPQSENIHLTKLDAFLACYPAGSAVAPLWHAWNNAPKSIDLPSAWRTYQAQLEQMNTAATQWNHQLTAQPDLASQLVKHCVARLE